MKQMLAHALQSKCPACGKSNIFESWGVLIERCPSCQLAIRSREPDTWFFMYMSTVIITGVFLVLFFFLIPPSWVGFRILLVFISAVIFLLSLPARKSLAIALDYWQSSKS